MRNTAILGWIMLFVVGMLIGCEEPEYDEMAVRKTKSVVVVPLQSSATDPSAGTIAAGLISTQLQSGDLPDLQVRVAPVLWRMAQPVQRGLKDAQAIQLAKTLGVDGVVTGSVSLTLETEKEGQKPKVLKAGQVPSSSVPQGDAVVTLRLLSSASGACIYKMNGRAKGDEPAKRMEQATDKAVNPLIGIWKRAQRGW